MVCVSEQGGFADTPLGRLVLRALQKKKAAELLRGKEVKRLPSRPAAVPQPKRIRPGGAGAEKGEPRPIGKPSGEVGQFRSKEVSVKEPPKVSASKGELGFSGSRGTSVSGIKPEAPRIGTAAVSRGMGPSAPPGSSLREPAKKQFSSLSRRDVGSWLFELGLLEPSELSDIEKNEIGGGGEVVDQLILKINALEALGYLNDVYIESEFGAVILIFDREMSLDLAVKLLLGLRDLMPGTQVIERPDEQDKSKKWIYLCTKEPVEIPEIEQQTKKAKAGV